MSTLKRKDICLSKDKCSCKLSCHDTPGHEEPKLNLGDKECSCNLCESCKNKEALPQETDQVTQELYNKVKKVDGNWLCVKCFQTPLCYVDFCYSNIRKDRELIQYFPDISIIEAK